MLALFLRIIQNATTKAMMPSTPRDTPTPIPAFAPVLNSAFESEEDEDEEVSLAFASPVEDAPEDSVEDGTEDVVIEAVGCPAPNVASAASRESPNVGLLIPVKLGSLLLLSLMLNQHFLA